MKRCAYVHKRFFFLLCLWVGLFLACRDRNINQHPFIEEYLSSDSTAFHGINPGDNIFKVRELRAGQEPFYDDELGLTYRKILTGGQELWVDYLADNLRTGRETDRVASIAISLRLNDEVEAAQLFNNLQELFRVRYGVSAGSYGAYSWQVSNQFISSVEVLLFLEDDKRTIRINFVDTRNLPDESREAI